MLYLAHPHYLSELCTELGNVVRVEGNLVFSPSVTQAAFAQDIWYTYSIIKFNSINEAAALLRKHCLRWFPNPVHCIRRMTLIAQKLTCYKAEAMPFPCVKAIPKIGVFSLLNEHTLIYSVDRWKAVPNGSYRFIEDRINPPNRAYLKLWEALTLLNHYPKPQDFVIDLGASPGGFTYVMHSFGARILAIDKAALDPSVAKLPDVSTQQYSAFSLDPREFGTVDWLLCDVACYPERLYHLLDAWITTGNVHRIIATIKLQGATDFTTIRRFQAIPNAQVLHLQHNKHELTFLWTNSGITC